MPMPIRPDERAFRDNIARMLEEAMPAIQEEVNNEVTLYEAAL